MSQPLAVAAAPVFASFRARTVRDRSGQEVSADAQGLEHRLDLVLDRLEQLEFTVGQLVAPDPDGETDRLALIEDRIEALHGAIASTPEADTTMFETRVDEIGVRQDAILEMLSTLAPPEAETGRLATALEDQRRLIASLPDTIAKRSDDRGEAPGDAIDALTARIEELCRRQATAQSLTQARFAEFERRMADEVFENLAFRVSKLVDARLAGSFARLADALDHRLTTEAATQPCASATASGDPVTAENAGRDAGTLAAEISASFRAAARSR